MQNQLPYLDLFLGNTWKADMSFSSPTETKSLFTPPKPGTSTEEPHLSMLKQDQCSESLA